MAAEPSKNQDKYTERGRWDRGGTKGGYVGTAIIIGGHRIY